MGVWPRVVALRLPHPSASLADEVTASPVYAPAYAYDWHHFGTRLTTLVGASATPPPAAGPRALDELRVAAAASLAAIAAMALAGGPPAWLGAGAAAWGLGLALPAAAAALACVWAPAALAALGAAENVAAARAAAAAGEGDWDAAYVRAAADAEARARERARARSRRSASSATADDADADYSGAPCDRAGHYAALGLTPGASQADVAAAFKGAALAFHPDRLPPDATQAQKDAANAKFRRMLAAYSVLRDPGKRARYDRGEWP